jgi:AcrR family transcriptional regulator
VNEGQDRVARKRAERVRLVEQTAARMFADKGYEGANLEEIAAQLDMRGSSLYHYFSSKEELFARCVENAASEVIRRLRQIAEADEPPRERLYRLFSEQVLIELRDYPDFVPLFLKIHVPVPEIRDRVQRLRREHGDVFRRVSDQVAAAEGLDPHAATISLLMAFGGLAYIQEWYDRDGRLEPGELADSVATALVATFPGR